MVYISNCTYNYLYDIVLYMYFVYSLCEVEYSLYIYGDKNRQNSQNDTYYIYT